MKSRVRIPLAALAMLSLLSIFTTPLTTCRAQGTAFTYQGQLQDNGGLANGTFNLRFALFTAPTGGSSVAGPVITNGVVVSNGLFTVTIDLGGSAWTGETNWLQISVETNGGGSFTVLSPRQQVTPTPYALFAEGANAAGLTGTLPPGSVPDSSLPADVALTDASQTFTGNNVFSLNVGIGTTGPAQQFLSVRGGENLDQVNLNAGILNNGSNNSYGLTFGSSSGEGIASERTAGANQYGLDFYTSFNQRMSLNNSGNLMLNSNDVYLLGASSSSPGGTSTYGLGYRTAVAGVSPSGGDGPFLFGYDAGYLGTRNPDAVALWWDWHGNTWVSNNLSATSLTVRGGSSPTLSASANNLSVNSGFFVVNGLTPVYCYIGDDGSGNDVQIGSQLSGITTVSAYNTADNAFMHIACSSISIKGGSDLAEPFKFSIGEEQIRQGAVVVIDEQNPGRLKMSDRAYDTRVAGVVSGANGIQPGIQMEQQGLLEGGKNVALTGRVYVQADAGNGAIKPGDLLTTSSTPGYAMKVKDHVRAQGAILGKAMTGLEKGRGMVLVLVTLQ